MNRPQKQDNGTTFSQVQVKSLAIRGEFAENWHRPPLLRLDLPLKGQPISDKPN
jgi:hypothetical protein